MPEAAIDCPAQRGRTTDGSRMTGSDLQRRRQKGRGGQPSRVQPSLGDGEPCAARVASAAFDAISDLVSGEIRRSCVEGGGGRAAGPQGQEIRVSR